MRTSPRVIGTAACGLALLVAGCTSNLADPEPGETESVTPVATQSPSPTDEPSPTESTIPEDPFAVPDPVTEAYVDRVVNTLYEEWGAITREILEHPADPSGITDVDTRERIAALFGGEYLQGSHEEADAILRGDRDGLLPLDDFSSVKWRSRHLFVANATCVVVAGDFDTHDTAVDSRSLLTALSLQPTESTSETGPVNETGWKIIDAVANTGEGGDVLEDSVMLEASLEDFGDLLTTSCEAS